MLGESRRLPPAQQEEVVELEKKAAMRNPTIRVLMMPRDTNAWGTIFGGVLLSHLDQAAGLEAIRNTDHRIVTIAMKEVVFHEPVLIGDLVSFYAETLRLGRTSITVKVEVEAERRGQVPIKVTEAEVTFVAIDSEGRPTPLRTEDGVSPAEVPPWPAKLPAGDPL
jgi:acyl-CoA thioesterase YciA